MLYVTSNDSTHLIQHRTVIAVGKSLHGHVRLVVADHNLHVAPDEQSPAILGPIDLVRHVIPIWHVVHPEGHVGPVGNLLGVVRVKAGGVRVEAPGVGRRRRFFFSRTVRIRWSNSFFLYVVVLQFTCVCV